MIKTLTKVGNSQALILDRTLLELIGVDDQGQVDLHVEGNRLILSPVVDDRRRRQIDAVSSKAMKRFARTYKRLAQP